MDKNFQLLDQRLKHLHLTTLTIQKVLMGSGMPEYDALKSCLNPTNKSSRVRSMPILRPATLYTTNDTITPGRLMNNSVSATMTNSETIGAQWRILEAPRF